MHSARLDACHIRDGRPSFVYKVAQIERFTLDDDGSLEGVADGKLRVLYMADDEVAPSLMLHEADAVWLPSESNEESPCQTFPFNMSREDTSAAVISVCHQECGVVLVAQEVSQHVERGASALDVAVTIESPDTFQGVHAQRLMFLQRNKFTQPHEILRLRQRPAHLLLNSFAECFIFHV